MYKPISVSRGNDSVEFVPFGATVTSWKVDGDEILFMSEKSLSDGKTPIRGGIPLVFPNFGAWELGPHHGFAHTKEWTIKEGPLEVENGDKTILWSLQDDESTRSIWKHRFEVLYRVTLRKAQLDLELSVENKGEDAFDFTALLHPFWLMKDVRQSKLSGCRDVIYSDKTKDFSEQREEREYVTVTQWTDNIYKSTASVHTLTGVGSGKTLTIEKKKNLPDTVVWNPWAKMAAELPDLGDDEYLRMLCVEPGHVAKPVVLEPSQRFDAVCTFKVTA